MFCRFVYSPISPKSFLVSGPCELTALPSQNQFGDCSLNVVLFRVSPTEQMQSVKYEVKTRTELGPVLPSADSLPDSWLQSHGCLLLRLALGDMLLPVGP